MVNPAPARWTEQTLLPELHKSPGDATCFCLGLSEKRCPCASPDNRCTVRSQQMRGFDHSAGQDMRRSQDMHNATCAGLVRQGRCEDERDDRHQLDQDVQRWPAGILTRVAYCVANHRGLRAAATQTSTSAVSGSGCQPQSAAEHLGCGCTSNKLSALRCHIPGS